MGRRPAKTVAMARTSLRLFRAPASPAGLAPPALLLLLVVALAKGDSSPSAADTDSASGSSLGSFLRRLMLDLFAWLGSLFGLGHGADDDASDYPVGGGDRGGSGRFPPRGHRISTASPQEVEHIGEEDLALSLGGTAAHQPEFSESSEERGKNSAGDGDPNASPESSSSPGVASVERVGAGDGVQGLRATSAEKAAGDDGDRPVLARVTV